MWQEAVTTLVVTVRVILRETLCIDFPPIKYYVRNGLRLLESIGETSSHRSIRLFAQRTLRRPVSHRSRPSCPPVVLPYWESHRSTLFNQVKDINMFYGVMMAVMIQWGTQQNLECRLFCCSLIKIVHFELLQVSFGSKFT